jgi:DNA-binding transcriptional LysR family regulator
VLLLKTFGAQLIFLENWQPASIQSNSKNSIENNKMLWGAMNLRQVEAFRTVMMTGKMTAAAELMAITQPAVSRLIRDFEFATKLRLFDRRGNQLTPTQEALTLMQEVERAFIGLSRIKAFAEEVRHQNAGMLRNATSKSFGPIMRIF